MVRLSERPARSRARRVATRVGVVAAGLGVILAAQQMTSAMADTGTLNYTCTASVLTGQPFTAVVRGTAPATAHVGDTVALSGFSVDVTANANATGALYNFLGVRSVAGTGSAETSVDNAGTPAPLPSTPTTIPATPVPATGPLTVSGAGTGPSFVTTTAGTVRFVAGPFRADLVGTTASGGTTAIPITCTLDAGQDPAIASVAVS